VRSANDGCLLAGTKDATPDSLARPGPGPGKWAGSSAGRGAGNTTKRPSFDIGASAGAVPHRVSSVSASRVETCRRQSVPRRKERHEQASCRPWEIAVASLGRLDKLGVTGSSPVPPIFFAFQGAVAEPLSIYFVRSYEGLLAPRMSPAGIMGPDLAHRDNGRRLPSARTRSPGRCWERLCGVRSTSRALDCIERLPPRGPVVRLTSLGKDRPRLVCDRESLSTPLSCAARRVQCRSVEMSTIIPSAVSSLATVCPQGSVRAWCNSW
jgi:hypothetical protein